MTQGRIRGCLREGDLASYAPHTMMQGALEDITKAVGNTPIVRLNRVTQGLPPGVEIYVKCEYLNPGGSHKDRLAWNLLRRAE